jgi:hypothetical protein
MMLSKMVLNKLLTTMAGALGAIFLLPVMADSTAPLPADVDGDLLKIPALSVGEAPAYASINTGFNLSREVAAYDEWQGAIAEDPRLWQSADGAADSSGGSDAVNPDCARFSADVDADVGDIIRAGCQPTTAQMSKLMDNPLGNVAMLFNQYDSYRMENPENGKEAIQGNFMGIIQFPKKLNENWNLINRIIYNVASAPLDRGVKNFDPSKAPEGGLIPPSDGSIPAPIDLFDGRTTNWGDTYYNGLFSPNEGIKMGDGSFLWGAGFDLGFPTASEDFLGTNKYLAGPSALGVYMGPKWKVGALVQQFWDYAGDDDASDVNLTNLQYFVFYSISETMSIGAAPNILANWEQDSDNAITFPVGIGINKTFQFGKIPVRVGIEAYYSGIHPDDVIGSKWSWRFYIIPAVPSAVFKWMG